MEISTIILLSLNGLLILSILFGFLYGIKRGLRKSGSRFIVVIIMAVIAFIVATPLSTTLMKMDISSIVQLSVDGTNYSNVNDYIQAYLQSNEEIADLMEQSDALKVLITQLPIVVANTIIFVLLFWILKLLSYPFWAIATKNAYKSKQKDGTERPKRRLWGGALGVVQGFLILCVTLVPLTGVIGLVKEIDETSKEVEAVAEEVEVTQDNHSSLFSYITKQLNLSDDTIKIYDDAIGAYDDSIFGKINNTVRINQVMFDTLTTIKLDDGRRIVLRQELKIVNDVYKVIGDFENIDFENIFKTLDIEKMEKLVNITFDSKLAASLVDELAPYYANKIIEDKKVDMDAKLYSLLRNYLDDYGVPKFNVLKNDLLSIIDGLKVLKTNGVIELIQNQQASIENIIDKMKSTATKNPINDFVNAIYNSVTIQHITMEGVNYGINVVDEKLSDWAEQEIQTEKIKVENVDWAKEKSYIVSILNNVADSYNTIKTFNESETINDYVDKIQEVSLEKVGNIVDNLNKSTLFGDAFKNICASVDSTGKFADYIELNALEQHLASWQQDFKILDNVLTDAIQVGFIDTLSNSENKVVSAVRFLNDNQEFATKTIAGLYSTQTIQSNLLKYVNLLENAISDNLEIEVIKSTQEDLALKEGETVQSRGTEFANSLNNTYWFMLDVLDEKTIDEQYMKDNSSKIASMLNAIKNCTELKNIYDTLLNYLCGDNEYKTLINDLIDKYDLEDINWDNVIDAVTILNDISSAESIDDISDEDVNSLIEILNDENSSEILDVLNDNEIVITDYVDEEKTEDLVDKIQNATAYNELTPEQKEKLDKILGIA